MPAFTPLRQFPFPVETDLINVPADIERLARSVDTVTANETVRRFGSITERNTVIPVPLEGQQCTVQVAPGANQNMRFIGRGGVWWALGMCGFFNRVTDSTFTADAVWQILPYTATHWNVMSSYDGSVWTSPFKGYVHVVAQVNISIVNAGGAATPVDTNQASLGFHLTEPGGGTAMLGGSSTYGRWGQVTLQADTVIGVDPGSTISVQGWCNAVGLSKWIHGGTGFLIEFI